MKSNLTIDTLLFEERDAQIFKIQDVKTKLNTLQNYFFPRLEFLVKYSLNLIQEIYEVNPYEKMSFVYRPSHRKSAKENKYFNEVYIGISGKKTGKPLKIIKTNGEPFVYYPSNLLYTVLPNSIMFVCLQPFYSNINDSYKNQIAELIENHKESLYPILSFGNIYHWLGDNIPAIFFPLHKAFTAEGSQFIYLNSPKYYFPINFEKGLNDLIFAFVVLFPLLDSFVRIADGVEPRLGEMLEKFKKWYIAVSEKNSEEQEEEKPNESAENSEVELPELDSYSFIRAGKWWEVLARDKWRCLSCGRSAKEDGVLLEVDHILPRSKGGSDDISNLQTLCKKCNIGKSNKDDTRLC